MKRVKIYYVLRLLISFLFGVAVGAAVLWADAYAVEIFDVLLIALGVITVLFNLPTLVISLRAILGKEKWEWINFALSLVSIAFGVCFALISRASPAFPIVLLVYIVVVPIARISLVSEHLKQMRLQLPKVLFGLFLLAVTVTKTEDVMFLVMGIAILTVSVLYLIRGFLLLPKKCRPYEEKFGE